MNIGIFVYENVILFDYAPVVEIFRVAGHGQAFNVFTVGETREPITTMDGLFGKITPSFDIHDSPPLDVLVIPGDNWPGLKARSDLTEWFRQTLKSETKVVTICTGAYVLAQAGLLADHDVTSLHSQLDLLQKLAPKARVHGDVPFVVSKGLITCAGAATSIDASLHMIRELMDLETSRWIAESYLDYEHWDSEYTGLVKTE